VSSEGALSSDQGAIPWEHSLIGHMVPTVRVGQGKSGSFKKSGKVMESQVKWRGSGKVREFYNSC